MSVPIPSAARALLNRMVRSQGPWRVWTIIGADLAIVQGSVAAGLVSLDGRAYRPTEAGRAAVAA